MRSTLLALFMLMAVRASAQVAPVINPGGVVFDASVNHIDVTRYVLEVLQQGQSTATFIKDLGKPAVSLDGNIYVTFFPSLESVLKPGTTYTARILTYNGANFSTSVISNTFTIATSCGIEINTSSYAVDPLGNQGSVQAQPKDLGCAWLVSSNATWLQINNPKQLTLGATTVVFSAGINSEFKPRTAIITIGEAVLTVTQAAVTCTYTLDSVVSPQSVAIYTPTAPTFTWSLSPDDTRAPQRALSPGRSPSAWYADAFSITVPDVSTAQKLAVYVVDYDSAGRQEKLELLNDAGAVLSTQTVTDFSQGKYLTWTVNGRVTIRATKLAGPNAVISGVFLSPNGTTPFGTASFNLTDVVTAGNWINKYGTSSYAVAGDIVGGALSALGGAGTLPIKTPSVCAWTATSDVPWLTTTSTGTGNGAASFTFTTNASNLKRDAVLAVGGQATTLTQLPGSTAPDITSCSLTGGEGITLTTTRYTASATGKPGAPMQLNYLLASKSPVNEITAYVDGAAVTYAGQQGGLVNLTAFTAIGFPTPASGTHKLSMKAVNLFGCEKTSELSTLLKVK